MIWIIGDIHGMLDPLVRLVSAIKMKESTFGKKISKFIFLGDYIDHGPNSKQVIDYLLNIEHEKVFLAGNHEDMFLQFYNKTELFDKYLKDLFNKNGMRETIASFNPPDAIHKKLYYPKMFRFSKSDNFKPDDFSLPDIYFDFLNKLSYSHTEEIIYRNNFLKFAFVHAGLNRKFDVEQQLKIKNYSDFQKFLQESKTELANSMIWTRELAEKKIGEYIVVNGHSPTILNDKYLQEKNPYQKFGYPQLQFAENEVKIEKGKYFRYKVNSTLEDLISINIDTGAVYGAYLTAIGISENSFIDNEINVLQVAVGGNHRNRTDMREFFFQFLDK